MIKREQYQPGYVSLDEDALSLTNLNKTYTKFNLLPIITQAPIIVGQPTNNFSQTTWKEYNSNKIVINQDKRFYYVDNTVVVVKGTAFNISIYTQNPANIVDPNSLEDLTFTWKRNNVVLNTHTNQNTNTITFTEFETTSNISGLYVCEVSNQYGSTTSDAINIVVLDTEADNFFNKNLIENGSGDSSADSWNATDQFAAQEMLDYYTTSGFSSANRKGYFKYSYDAKYFDDDEPTYSLLPSLIDNDSPSKDYAAFFPSVYKFKPTNYNIKDSINYYYLGAKDVTYGQDNTIQIIQNINLVDYGTIIDGGAYGIRECGYELFHYMGSGILNYDWVLNDEYTFNTIYPSTQEYSSSIRNIKIKQIIDTKTTGYIEFLDIGGNLLERRTFEGPDVRDLSAVTNKNIHVNNLTDILDIIPNRKIDLTRLTKRLFINNKINYNEIYYKLPTFRFPSTWKPEGTEDGYQFTFDTSEPKQVKNIYTEPVKDYELIFNGFRVTNTPRTINIISSLKSDAPNKQSNVVKALKSRIVAMDMMLDFVTYGMQMDKNLTGNRNDNQLYETLLVLFMTLVTTVDSQTTEVEKQDEFYNSVMSVSEAFLDLSVKHQDEGYQATVGEIYKDYFTTQYANKVELKNKIINEYNQAKQTSPPQQLSRKRIELLEKWMLELWRDYIINIGYIEGDFRFRKLSNLININGYAIKQKIFETGTQPYFEMHNQLEILNGVDPNELRALETRIFNKIFPQILNDDRTLKLGYLKLLDYDMKPENQSKLPLVVQPESQRGEIFFNNKSTIVYGAFAKGAAAFFGYHYTGSIPTNTRSANVSYTFELKNKNINNTQPIDWPSDQVTIDNYSVYSIPRVGVAGATMLVQPVKEYESNFTSSLSIDPNNVWQKSKNSIKYVAKDDLEIVYNTSTAQTNLLNIANNQIKAYIDILPQMSDYFSYIEGVIDTSTLQNVNSGPPSYYDKEDLRRLSPLILPKLQKDYPLILQLINRYEYLNYLNF